MTPSRWPSRCLRAREMLALSRPSQRSRSHDELTTWTPQQAIELVQVQMGNGERCHPIVPASQSFRQRPFSAVAFSRRPLPARTWMSRVDYTAVAVVPRLSEASLTLLLCDPPSPPRAAHASPPSTLCSHVRTRAPFNDYRQVSRVCASATASPARDHCPQAVFVRHVLPALCADVLPSAVTDGSLSQHAYGQSVARPCDGLRATDR